MSDVLISASFQEGLPINLIEGLSSGLPAVASSVRGHTDVVKHSLNGYLFKVDSTGLFINCIDQLYSNSELYRDMSCEAVKTAENFSIENSLKQMEQIYKKYGK